eukprot:CAMPEP_0169367362 /NCGR_PEP_ID=MMETSP1017-20121227/33623_1 /TAXON_ID=342587 /ORGANISM="Karlodinium micrum, Strain CCMP2283" /LENGTH=95 /DNA_ID=CAMNT_0009465387 /DNA_START=587 /DNA_END=874 /DNA_ORIENTATION=+
MNIGVPQLPNSFPLGTIADSPKSHNFNILSFRLPYKTLSGLISRWTMPLECTWAMAASIWLVIRAMSISFTPVSLTKSHREHSHFSMTIQNLPLV